MLISRDRSSLLLVDVQERLAPAMSAREQMERNAGILLRAAGRLGVPVVVSEQYPRGLGHTVPALAELVPAGATIEKVHFSCAADPTLRQRLDGLRGAGREQVIVAGIEAHVCVLQTALALQEAGFAPAVVADATASRTQGNHEAGLARLRQNGVEIVTTEMVLFEWLGRAGGDEFRELTTLIK